MTVHLLDVTPRDVAADALGLLLDAPAPEPLAELVLRDGRGGVLVLGVLGASHVVTATTPGHRLTEQVSCDAVAAGGQRLPASARSGGYEMSATITSLPAADLDASAARLRARARSGADWLCGTFPGASSALTALTAGPLPSGGWTWSTWHLYPGPQTGDLVATTSRWSPS
ncbi:DUF2617 family protein [Modestobacter lapidis]|nr:DUF2617 family protein [Modestobacter lapidis]